MKQIVAVALTIALLSGSAAYACTPQELAAKTAAVTTRIQALTKTNPQAASEWSRKFALEQATPPKSVDEACTFYDNMLASLPTS